MSRLIPRFPMPSFRTSIGALGGIVASTVGIVGAISLAGFTAGGVVAGSLAASVQSLIGNVAAGSIFAALQSLTATGAIWGIAGGVSTAGAGLYVAGRKIIGLLRGRG